MRMWAATVIVWAGCSQPAGELVRLSIAPAQPVHFHLYPEGELADVRLTSPAGYSFQNLDDIVFGTRRDEIGDPTIAIQTIALDVFTHKPKSFALRDENCDLLNHPTGEWHVLSRAPEPNGVSLVCEHRRPEGTSTVLARELTWHGHSIQCEVRFSNGTDDKRYAEPTPSKARMDDAFEICKSMQLHGIVPQQP